MDDVYHCTVEPDRRDGFPYLGGSRGTAVAALSRAIHDGDALLLLTGPAGVGKSTVLGAALALLVDEPIRVIRLSNPGKSAWGQSDVAQQLLGRPPETSRSPAETAAVLELPETTFDETQIVIAVDDAQTLTDDAMELLLLMASPLRQSRIVPQLILSGRGAFWERPWREELRMITGLADRVILEPFADAEARDYIAFCLKRNGGPIGGIIPPEALAAISHHSAGLPGQIDRIVAASILTSASNDDEILTADIVEAAIAAPEAGPDLNADKTVAAPPRAASLPLPPAARVATRWGWAARAAAVVAIFLTALGAAAAVLPGPRAMVARAVGWPEPPGLSKLAAAAQTAIAKVVPLAARLTGREANVPDAVLPGSRIAPPAADEARPLSAEALATLEEDVHRALTDGRMDEVREKMIELQRHLELNQRAR